MTKTAARKAGVLDERDIEPIADFLRGIKPMPAVFDNKYVTRIHGTNVKKGKTKRDLAGSSIPSALAGHVGDGNFHLIFMIDPTQPEEIAEASRLNDRMVARALAMEGTCTGEHGIGCGKMDFLLAEHGEAVSVMRSIKTALDPDGIMNPGKIVRL